MKTAPTEPSALHAGVGKADITGAGPSNDPLYAKALVLKNAGTTVVIITIDAVAIEEIGPIKNGYLDRVRTRLKEELDIDPECVLVNVSHCHGIVCADVEDRTVQAVREACQTIAPVRVGVGTGREDRISINRRPKLKNGREADVRRAYALPPDEDIAGVGPIDPDIGIVRLDRLDGKTLSVVYHFACHPIQGVPGGGNSADLTGFASRAIEDTLSDGAMAFFLQGCTGDINPVLYKDTTHPHDAELLGNKLGLSTLKALRTIQSTENARLTLIREMLELPRADLGPHIEALQAEQMQLLQSLKGTSLNLKTFLPLIVKYSLSPDYPSADAHEYLHQRMIGRDDLHRLDAENRQHIAQYVRNIHTMEALTRVQTNLNLLKKHQSKNAGRKTIEVEVLGLRIGDFVLATFPGELCVQTGLNLKHLSPHPFTFISGYTNGYIYYAPTEEQLKNTGGAQEDSDCLLGPGWEALYEKKALDLLNRL